MRETRRLKLIIYFHNCLRVMEKHSMTFFCAYMSGEKGLFVRKKEVFGKVYQV